MTDYVADTMAVVSYLGKRRLPPAVKQLFQSADIGLCTIFIPVIVAVEISYLSEKSRIDVSLADLRQHIAQYSCYRMQDLTIDIVETAFQITDIPELHDRLVGGTARFKSLKLITNDPVIQNSAFLETIW